MHARNHWGGSFEINGETGGGGSTTADDDDRRSRDWDRASLAHQRQFEHLDETQQSWLLGHTMEERKKKKYVDLGCVVCSREALKWTFYGFTAAFFLIALPIIIAKSVPRHKPRAPPPDNYTVALHKALLFFNAQKSGKLPKSNGISWRGDSGLQDGSDVKDSDGGVLLVGGYYDAGDNTKFHFPMSFALTMLSWSVIEYSHKYQAIGEYNHVRDIIKWGTDYLLLTFNSSSTKIDKIYSQVGGSRNGSTTPDDHTCWERPEDMDYPRPTQVANSGPDLAGEMAAALAAASIVFRDNTAYSKKLTNGAQTVYAFARDGGRRTPYSRGNAYIDPYYNSTGYYDEYMWGATWLYYATGNSSYISLATNPGIPKNAKAFYMVPELSALSWDNKLPAAMLLLTRFRVFLNPGYPYEDMLRMYHNVTGLTMCSYLQQFHVFNWTKGGMIELNLGKPQPLQYIANAAFLASLYVDYLNATGVPGWNCGPTFISAETLRQFATSQMDYILGNNPAKTSYVVGYGNKYPKNVHHRASSIPRDGKKYGCQDGFKWLDNRGANPNMVTGAMVAGPDKFDQFKDVRRNYSYTEPTLVGNAGLVAALVSLTTSGGSDGVDKNTIFAAVPPLYPISSPPPPQWKPVTRDDARNRERGGGLHFLLRSPSEIKLKRRPLAFSLPGLGGGDAAPAHSTVRLCTASNGGVAAPEAVAEVSDPLEERKKARDAANTLDVRVGRILKAWRHEEAESLYVEEVDVGEPEPRIICSGLVNYVPVENLQGSSVIVLANLKPGNMRGVKSCGMLMAALDASHENVELLLPPDDSLPGDQIWFGAEDEKQKLPQVATPNQAQKKKIWESVQPRLRTDKSPNAVLFDHFMRTPAGLVTCRSLRNAIIS